MQTLASLLQSRSSSSKGSGTTSLLPWWQTPVQGEELPELRGQARCEGVQSSSIWLSHGHSSGVRALAAQAESCKGLRRCYSRCLMSGTKLPWTRLQHPKLPAERKEKVFLC